MISSPTNAVSESALVLLIKTIDLNLDLKLGDFPNFDHSLSFFFSYYWSSSILINQVFFKQFSPNLNHILEHFHNLHLDHFLNKISHHFLNPHLNHSSISLRHSFISIPRPFSIHHSTDASVWSMDTGHIPCIPREFKRRVRI